MTAKQETEKSIWGGGQKQFDVFARNVLTNYVTMGIEMVVGVLLLPFNIAHLGPAAYGLLVLTASVTTYFSMLDLGYADAQVKFAAQYRAQRNSEALNQIVSTLFFMFAGIGLVVYGVGTLLAFNLSSLFNLTPEQASTGRTVLLIISFYVALGFPFSVFGGIVNGFQRQYVNGIVSVITSIVVAIVNVAVLLAGYGLVELVAATTTVRVLSYFAYRMNAYRVFPLLRIRPKYFSTERLREVTGFSIFIVVIDLANKLSYSTDTIVIGMFMSTSAIAVWAVAARLIEVTQRLTGQINNALFPVVVDSATMGQPKRLQMVLLQGTRLSLAMVILMATGLVVLAKPVIQLWVGPRFAESLPIIYILAAAVTIRVGCSTATTLLKGAGQHRLLAGCNLTMAVANLVLSIILVQFYGLIGVALGTLIPLSIGSILVLFPIACRRVELPLWQALTAAVWPAIWPVIPVALFLLATSRLIQANPATIALQALTAGLMYGALFLGLAIPRDERHWYLAKGKQLLRRPRVAPALQ